MESDGKRILIIDEAGFARVCSAILEFEGYNAEAVTGTADLTSLLGNRNLGLIIVSLPYGCLLFDEIKKSNVPTIILSDQLSEELNSTLEDCGSSYCMIKPIDYSKFRYLVRQVMDGNTDNQGGFNIV